jgi:Chlorophyll A-B binding protein
LTPFETMRYIRGEQQHPLKVNPMQDTKTVVATPATGDRNAWKFGFTEQAELWNGRFAMLGFVAALATEYATSQGVMKFLGLM